MKILNIKFEKIGLFNDGLNIDFTCKDRVPDPSQVTKITGNIYTQRLIGLVGVNASGKSTALKLIKFAMDILLGHKSLEQAYFGKGIIKNESVMIIDFFYNEKLYRIKSIFGDDRECIDDLENELYYKDEIVYCKKKSSVKSKSMIFSFSEKDIIHTRKEFEEQEYSVLKLQDSIILAITKEARLYYDDMIKETNFNLYRIKGKAPIDFINLFDDSIKSLTVNDENLEVSFKSDSTTYACNSPIKGYDFLSSGTIKGGNLIYKTEKVLKKGGYLLVDEIEIHMHKELVLTIIDFFNDEEVNKFGATLIFTTHYSEILDSIDRKDNIYIMRKGADYRCEAVRYSDEIHRNDIKKSEIFLSNYIKGTAPSYESIEKVRKFICRN